MGGGPGQPAAPNLSAAAMTSILPEVRRKEEGKSRRRRAGAGAAEGGDSGVRTGGQGQTGKGGKGQAGVSGARRATRHHDGKGGKGGGQVRQWPQPQHSFKQQQPGLPQQVSAALRAEEEREARRQQTGRYQALACMERQRRRRQAPEPGRKKTTTGWRWSREAEGRSDRWNRRGQKGCTADNPVADRREAKGRQDRAAQQRRGATARGRGDRRVGASEVDRQAARCRAGMQG